MPARIATFEKVSFEEFKKSLVENNHLLTEEHLKEVYDNIKLPERATKDSAGYDFFSPLDVIIRDGNSEVIPTGIRCKIDEGWYLGCFPRSGLGFKYRVSLDNTVGIIDGDYYYADNEGHIKIKIHSGYSDSYITILSGKAFVQGIFMPYGLTTDDAADGIRTNGFGSTDKK